MKKLQTDGQNSVHTSSVAPSVASGLALQLQAWDAGLVMVRFGTTNTSQKAGSRRFSAWRLAVRTDTPMPFAWHVLPALKYTTPDMDVEQKEKLRQGKASFRNANQFHGTCTVTIDASGRTCPRIGDASGRVWHAL